MPGRAAGRPPIREPRHPTGMQPAALRKPANGPTDALPHMFDVRDQARLDRKRGERTQPAGGVPARPAPRAQPASAASRCSRPSRLRSPGDRVTAGTRRDEDHWEIGERRQGAHWRDAVDTRQLFAGDEILVTAILVRLLHRSHVLKIKGPNHVFAVCT